jgi:hypothetical protein
MQSGKIAPIFRQFFTAALNPNRTDSNAEQRQSQGEPEREPTHEEALEALDLLTQQEEFQKNDLRAELKQLEGRWMISVLNRAGAQLRMIRGMEIVRLLDKAGLGKKGHSRGRILDRRV